MSSPSKQYQFNKLHLALTLTTKLGCGRSRGDTRLFDWQSAFNVCRRGCLYRTNMLVFLLLTSFYWYILLMEVLPSCRGLYYKWLGCLKYDWRLGQWPLDLILRKGALESFVSMIQWLLTFTSTITHCASYLGVYIKYLRLILDGSCGLKGCRGNLVRVQLGRFFQFRGGWEAVAKDCISELCFVWTYTMRTSVGGRP